MSKYHDDGSNRLEALLDGKEVIVSGDGNILRGFERHRLLNILKSFEKAHFIKLTDNGKEVLKMYAKDCKVEKIIRALRSHQEDMNKELKQIQGELGKLQSKANTLQSNINSIEVQISFLGENRRELKGKLEDESFD
jgi:chromosome segregation ATPase